MTATAHSRIVIGSNKVFVATVLFFNLEPTLCGYQGLLTGDTITNRFKARHYKPPTLEPGRHYSNDLPLDQHPHATSRFQAHQLSPTPSAITHSSSSYSISQRKPTTSLLAPPIPSSTTPPQISPPHTRIRYRQKKKKSPAPVHASLIGSKRQNLKAMHRVKQKQELVMKQRSLPRHSSQLLGLNGTTSVVRQRQVYTRRERRRRRTAALYTAVPGYQRYSHVHYHGVRPFDPRTRFHGFQHFLRYARAGSSRGIEVYRSSLERRQRALLAQRRRSQFSSKRKFVRVHDRLLEQLRGTLRYGAFTRAVRIAKEILKIKPIGAKQPSAKCLLRLVKHDQSRYLRVQRAYHQSDRQLGLSSQKADRFFTTTEYNVILSRCEEIKDWSHGYLISQILLKRYLSPKFAFGALPVDFGVPDTRTIHLMVTLFVKSGHPDRAALLFTTMAARYPKKIPLNVYESYLQLLATLPDQLPTIKSTLQYLETHGQTPSTTLYNTVIKAIGRQEGAAKMGLLVETMAAEGFKFDQQSYRLLMLQCLREQDLQGAHRWLAEHERQGFQVRTSTLEPLMKTCTQLVVYYTGRQKLPTASRKGKAQKSTTILAEASQEWLNQALRVFQLVSDKKLVPSMSMYNMLIEALLAQSHVAEAQKVLMSMTDAHLYTPSHKTWSLFFNHHLESGDYLSAMKVLNTMRLHPEPVIDSSVALQAKKPFAPIRPPPAVPTRMYRALFQHLLDNRKLSLAERNLYEMMVHQGRTVRPTEKQVVDLIWKLELLPEAAERVYELLYSRTLDPREHSKDVQGAVSNVSKNRIMSQGPIQMANVGVMHAKSRSATPSQHDDVWKSWTAITQYYQNQANQTTSSVSSKRKEQSVVALAFEQVARASRKLAVKEHHQEQAEGLHRKPATDSWDFSQIRRGPGVGAASLGLGAVHTFMAGGPHATRHLEFKGKHRQVIQQLLKRQDYLQPLLERQNANTTSVPSVTMEDPDTRLENLKSSFGWMQLHHVPIRPEGLNMYLKSLISHGDFKSVRETLEKVEEPRRDNASSSLRSINEDTLKILEQCREQL
ncbi:hypothetical protein MVEG_09893 [Podila verticillata NRRL 6337]|nr:hypothetical protein MVEG_09893 [Podila verticillata NRRL 6337]